MKVEAYFDELITTGLYFTVSMLRKESDIPDPIILLPDEQQKHED